jgi:hypothetical protein
MESCTRNRDRALGAEVKLVGQGGTDDGCIGASVQKEVVGAGMVDEYGQDNLVAVHEAEGYTGDISRAMVSADSAGTRVAVRKREANHLEVVIARAP